MKIGSLILFLLLLLNGTGEGGESSMGERFHKETILTPLSVIKSIFRFTSPPPPLKKYKTGKEIKLPKPDLRGLYLEEAIKKRRSIRHYKNEPLQLKEVSQLLFAAQGVTGRAGGQPLRSAPSAGALYPFEIYLIVNDVEGLQKGIYHYSPIEHSIEMIRSGDYRGEITRACLDQEMVGEAGVVFVLTAIFERTTWKYGERGYRYVYMEAGHISQNIYLQATSLGLGSVVIGAFYDKKVDKLLGIDGERECTIYIHAVGKI